MFMFLPGLAFPRPVGYGQLPMQFQKYGIVDEVPKVTIFENIYLSVNFGKSFIFFKKNMLYLFLVLKNTL